MGKLLYFFESECPRMKQASHPYQPGQSLAHGGHSEMLISFLTSPDKAFGNPHIIFSRDLGPMLND